MYLGNRGSSLHHFVMACWRATTSIFSRPPLLAARWSVRYRGETYFSISRVFLSPNPYIFECPKDECAFVAFVGPEEVLAKELRRTFTFGPYAIGCCCVEIEGGVVRLGRRVKVVKGIAGVCCLKDILVSDESFSIYYPQEFDGFQEVASNLLDEFGVVVGGFFGDGRKFGRPILEEDGDLLNCGHFVLEHVGKLITSDEDRHGTV